MVTYVYTIFFDQEDYLHQMQELFSKSLRS